MRSLNTAVFDGGLRLLAIGLPMLLAAGWCLEAASTSTLATVQGHLYSDLGAPLKGVKVTANLASKQAVATGTTITVPISSGPTITGPIQAAVLSGADGSFTLNQLPAGTYTICAQAALAGQLDPCHWSQTPQQVTVAAGQSLSGVSISTIKGNVLTIKVTDLKGLLFGALSPQGRPHLLVGVYTAGGQFYPALLSSKDLLGYTYTLTIPFDTNLRLAISSRQLKLADSLGAALPLEGVSYLIRPSSLAGSSTVFQFQVNGSN